MYTPLFVFTKTGVYIYLFYNMRCVYILCEQIDVHKERCVHVSSFLYTFKECIHIQPHI